MKILTQNSQTDSARSNNSKFSFENTTNGENVFVVQRKINQKKKSEQDNIFPGDSIIFTPTNEGNFIIINFKKIMLKIKTKILEKS